MITYSRERLALMVGGLLYAPAVKEGIAGKITDFPCLTSMAFCLEDAICDDALENAEKTLLGTLKEISRLPDEKIPLIFIRIRNPEHLMHIHDMLSADSGIERIVTGYILPKFDLSNCCEYKQIITEINAERDKTVYIMPILESPMIADTEKRSRSLAGIKQVLDSMREYVLNVRVGGNDFSNLYGLRRSVSQNIYQIGVIRDIFADIINVFASDYVVSGAVWEYFGKNDSEPWAKGLETELELDRLNGFVGKTAIHPCQLPLIYKSLQPCRADYEDAVKILGWDSDKLGVGKSADGTRMNEVKCHAGWAKRIVDLAEIYGIKENTED